MSTGFSKRLIWTNPWVFVACGFGVGALPVMPGTYGTLLGVLLVWGLHALPVLHFVAVLVVLFLSGVALCGYANRQFGTDDHPAAVWDEIVTFPWVMFTVEWSWLHVALGFVLFRFFDIVKPGPIGWVDKRCHGGWGVMLDDLLAALASCLVLQVIVYFGG